MSFGDAGGADNGTALSSDSEDIDDDSSEDLDDMIRHFAAQAKAEVEETSMPGSPQAQAYSEQQRLQWQCEVDAREAERREANLRRLGALGLCGMAPQMMQAMAYNAWKEYVSDARRQRMKTPEQRRFEEELAWELEGAAASAEEVELDPAHIGVVVCRFTIFNIREINIKTQSILVDFYFEAAWPMPDLLQEDGSIKPQGEIEWDKVWQPRIVFANKLGDLQLNAWNAIDPSYLEKFGQPMASWRAKISGEFSQQLDLRKFPYDGHNLELLISTDHLTSICTLAANVVVPSGAQVARFSIRDQWDLTFDGKSSIKSLGERKGAGGAYSQLSLCLPAKRNPNYQLANTMLLMALVVMLFFVSVFPVPKEQTADRMVIASNSVLTAVALKLLSAEQLPDLPYMTFLDKYMLFCIFLLVALIFYGFLLDFLARRTPLRKQSCEARNWFDDCNLEQIDFLMGNFGLVLWGVSNFSLYKPLLKRRNKGTGKPSGYCGRFTQRLQGMWTKCKRSCSCSSRQSTPPRFALHDFPRQVHAVLYFLARRADLLRLLA
jgi:hypothetical protein